MKDARNLTNTAVVLPRASYPKGSSVLMRSKERIGLRSSQYRCKFYLLLAIIGILFFPFKVQAVVKIESAVSDEQAKTTFTLGNKDRTLSRTYSSSGSTGNWKKFTVVTQNNFTFSPPGLPTPTPGMFLTSQGAVSNLKANQLIGNFNQACILPLTCSTCAQLELSYDCSWTVSLSLQGGTPGTITLQGAFSYPCFGTTISKSFPSPQYAVITGGTGCFRSLIGVVKIQPLSPATFTCPVPGSNSIPLLFQYTFYIKEVS